jgi:hypothetical protein
LQGSCHCRREPARQAPFGARKVPYDRLAVRWQSVTNKLQMLALDHPAVALVFVAFVAKALDELAHVARDGGEA